MIDTLIGKHVATAHYGTGIVIENDGGQGMVLIYRVALDNGGVIKSFADTNLRVVD